MLVTVPVVEGSTFAIQFAPAFMVIFAGTVKVGAVMSWTLIVCDFVEELPQSSTAFQVLVTEYEPAHWPLVVTSSKVKETDVST